MKCHETGATPEFSGLRRLRVGDYRVVYEAIANELTVLVVRLAHRREASR